MRGAGQWRQDSDFWGTSRPRRYAGCQQGAETPDQPSSLPVVRHPKTAAGSYLTSALGRPNRIVSSATRTGLTCVGPSALRFATISSTSAGAADAPAVTPTVDTSARAESGTSLTSCTSRARVPAASERSTRRTELEEFAEPTTSRSCASAATARTAFCRLVVA